VIDNAAVALADVSPLMLTPGLRCENGRLAPVTEPDWIRFTQQMIDVSRRTYAAAQTRSQEAVSDATGDLSDACAACHQVYREGRGGRGAAAGAAATASGDAAGNAGTNGAANAGRCLHR
jgi:hypothetical protein